MKGQKNKMRLVSVELTAAELRRLQICLYERGESLQERLKDSQIDGDKRRALMVDAVNCAADLKILTEKALAV